MEITEAIVLGLVQGFTEFIPVSSSGHLVLAEHFLGLDTANLMDFDILVHAGTLFALVFLFWDKLFSILKGNYKLFAQLVVATIPATIFGLTFKDFLEENMRTVGSVALAFIILGAFFLLPGLLRKNEKLPQKITWWQVIGMGFAQAFAIIPGVSRSGSTVATGNLMGLKRENAAEFSFLMLVPVVCGALILVLVKGDVNLPTTNICVAGFITSAISSFVAAKFMLGFFKKFGLNIFAYYLLLAGMLLMLL